MDYKLLYRNGIIAPHYLRDSQLKLYDMLQTKKKVVVNTHRRWGKSSTVFTHIFEQSLRHKITSRCGGQTQKAFFDIYNTMEEEIFTKCEIYKPKWSADEGCYKFPLTQSKTHLFGVSDKAEADKGRGAKADIIYCDEYGFWSYKARYMLTSVLGPQLDTTDGQIIITSTPPEDLTHDYIEQINEAIRGGYYFYWDLNDSLKSGEVTPEMHEKIIIRCGGMDTDAYKREYLCQLIAPSNRLVIPEAADRKFVIKENTRPECYDSYAGFDLGLKDFTSGEFGYYDFKRGVLVIEDELMMNYKTTDEIVKRAKEIEERLGYKNVNRVSDSEMQQIFDMNVSHKYRVRAVVKRTEEIGISYKESLLNALRIAIKQGKIEVMDKCKNTINQMCFGIWKDNRQDFVRTEELGHLDSLMALAYLWDYVDKRKNPYPSTEDYIREKAKEPDMQVNWRTRVNNGIKEFMDRKHKGKTKI